MADESILPSGSYVYAIRVDGIVRYIGKGQKYRMRDHVRRAKNDKRRREAGLKVRTSYFHRQLAAALDAGAKVDGILLVDGLSCDEALTMEAMAVANAPAGTLWNTQAGGRRGRTIRDGHRHLMSERAKARFSKPEEVEKIKAGIREANSRPEVSERRSAAGRRMWQDEEKRARLTAALRAMHANPEVNAKKRAAAIKRGKDPEYLAGLSERSKSAWVGKKPARRAALKAAWDRPETRAKHRAYLDSPDGRAKLRAASRARWAKDKAQT